MSELKKTDLKKLDEKIDSSIASQTILSQPTDLALVHLLRYFEDYVRLYATRAADYSAAVKKGQDGMHFAIQWIYRYCPPVVCKSRHRTQDNIYRQAHQLHEAAMNYSIVWDLMAMLWRGRATAERDADGTVRLCYANQLIADVEVADRLISAPDAPDMTKNISSLRVNFDPSELLREITTQPAGRTRVRYAISDSAFQKAAELVRKTTTHLWELDPTWDLNGYGVAQFREFWVALKALCWIHHWACFSSNTDGGALDSVVNICQRRRWENEVAKHSGLPRPVVSTILEDLIYNPTLYQPNRKQPDVTYQPFFPLDSDLLALSNWLVLLSNAERNIWDLLSIIRPRIHSALCNKKEGLWLQELKRRLESYGLKAYGPMQFRLGGCTGDIDLLLLDDAAKFGVCCELKWLTAPDRIRDVKYTEGELKKGLSQAELSLQWLNQRTGELQLLTGLDEKELRRYEFKAMVLSKNTIGSGWVHRSEIPIVNDRLLNWILADPHRRRLRTLWQVGEERRYLPKRGKHFTDTDIDVEFGGIRFLGQNMGMRILSPWEPTNDIDLTGLD